jgi:hypothetical protein
MKRILIALMIIGGVNMAQAMDWNDKNNNNDDPMIELLGSMKKLSSNDSNFQPDNDPDFNLEQFLIQNQKATRKLEDDFFFLKKDGAELQEAYDEEEDQDVRNDLKAGMGEIIEELCLISKKIADLKEQDKTAIECVKRSTQRKNGPVKTISKPKKHNDNSIVKRMSKLKISKN